MNLHLQDVWKLAEDHGPDVALSALALSAPIARIAAEFGLPVAEKAAYCIALEKQREDVERQAEEAESELDEITQGLSEERSDHLLSLMFPAN